MFMENTFLTYQLNLEEGLILTRVSTLGCEVLIGLNHCFVNYNIFSISQKILPLLI